MQHKVRYKETDKAFLNALQTKVEAYFTDNAIHKFGDTKLYWLSGVGLVLYLFCSYHLFVAESIHSLYFSYAMMGPLSVFLALNIGHDAAHGVYCKNKTINKVLVYIFDLLGVNGRIWRYKHVHSHHMHTNIYEVDLELKQPALVRLFPQSTYRWFHRYQQYYMPILYCHYTLIWFCFRDMKDFLELKNEMHNGKPLKEFMIFGISKITFVTRMIVIPSMILPWSIWVILGGFLVSNLMASICLTFALISTHVGEHSEFYDLEEGRHMPHSWVQHQFKTTSDFSTSNPLVTWFYGAFNHHLTHHLFPYISQIHYKAITPIVHNTALDYGITSYSQPGIKEAICSHFRLLRVRAREGMEPPEWMEV